MPVSQAGAPRLAGLLAAPKRQWAPREGGSNPAETLAGLRAPSKLACASGTTPAADPGRRGADLGWAARVLPCLTSCGLGHGLLRALSRGSRRGGVGPGGPVLWLARPPRQGSRHPPAGEARPSSAPLALAERRPAPAASSGGGAQRGPFFCPPYPPLRRALGLPERALPLPRPPGRRGRLHPSRWRLPLPAALAGGGGQLASTAWRSMKLIPAWHNGPLSCQPFAPAAAPLRHTPYTSD